MAGLSDYFCGRVDQREYSQVHDFEFVPNYVNITDQNGNTTTRVASYTRNLVTARVVEQTFRFEGVPASLAESTGSVTVSDVGGASYTFALVSSVTDGSTGSRVFEVESVQVSRARATPHMRTLTVTRRATRYYLNGSRIALANEPAWASAYF